MPEFVSIYANGNSGTVVTVTEAFAKSIDAKVLADEPAVNTIGKPLPPREAGTYKNPPEPTFAPAIRLPEKSDAKTAPAQQTEQFPIGGPAVSQPEEAIQ